MSTEGSKQPILNNIIGTEALESVFTRRIIHELPIRFPGYTAVMAAKGYAYLFPQAFTIFEGRIYILYEGHAGSSGTGSWVSVHQIDTGAYISGFSFATTYGEGLTVLRSGTHLYMYAQSSSKTLGKYDITTLPANQATITPIQTYNLDMYTQFCWDGAQFTVQQLARASAPSKPRNLFARYDSTLAFKSRLTFDPSYIWSIQSDLIPLNVKLQGIAAFCGGYAGGYGATHHYGNAETPDKIVGIRLFTDCGELMRSGLMHPDKFIDILRTAGCTVSLIENEGICAYDGNLYALWVTSSHTNTGASGIVITQELEGDLSCEDAATSSTYQNGIFNLNAIVDQDDNGLKNPLTGTTFTSLVQIVEFMRDAQIMRYAFFTTGSNIADFDGATLGLGFFIEIITGDYLTWRIELTRQGTRRTWWVTGPEGALVRTIDPVTISGPFTSGSDFISLGVSNSGRIAVGRPGTSVGLVHEFYNANGRVGSIRVLDSSTRYYLTEKQFVQAGSGSPEGVVVAPIGCMYLRSNGGPTTTLYVKTSGSGNTGWTAK